MDETLMEIPMERLKKIPLPISVRICERSLKVGDLLKWGPGSILTFEKLASAPLQLCIGDQAVGEGKAIKFGEKIGLRIQRINQESTRNS